MTVVADRGAIALGLIVKSLGDPVPTFTSKPVNKPSDSNVAVHLLITVVADVV